MARVLIGCETSGVVREAFLARGHDAWSCDLLPPLRPSNRHIIGDVREVMMMDEWDLMAVMHPPCFAADTLVLTSEGYREISEVEVGDLVLTHKGRWRRVNEVMSKTTGRVVTVKSSNSLRTVTTPEHPYLVRFREPYRHNFRTQEERNNGPEWIDAGELTRRHFTCSVLPPEERVEIPDKTLWLMGRYVADGHMRSSRWTPGKFEEMVISVGYHKRDSFLAMVDRKVTLHPGRTAIKATFYGHDAIRDFAQFGRSAHTKVLPGWVLKLPADQAAYFLEGYVSGDGYRHARGRIDTSSVSRVLSLGISVLMQRVYKKCPSLRHQEPRKQHRIEGRLVNNAPAVTASVHTAPSRTGNYVDGIHAWGRVREVTPDWRRVKVYNLSVEEDETYTANGVVVHNCTRLANSGVRWLYTPPGNPPDEVAPDEAELWHLLSDAERLAIMWRLLEEGADLFSAVWNVPHIPAVAVENPVMHKHAKARIRNFRRHSQSVQPWQFGTDKNGPDNERKRTCLWLRNLPLLVPTGTLDGSTARDSVHKATPGPDRWKLRSRFFPGLAAAMAHQWGDHAASLKAEAA